MSASSSSSVRSVDVPEYRVLARLHNERLDSITRFKLYVLDESKTVSHVTFLWFAVEEEANRFGPDS